jgi:8-amino-7-oxononanoate synthase
MTNPLQRYADALQERAENNSLRKLQIGKGGIDFYSNDYLGLAQNDELRQKIAENYNKLSPQDQKNGSTGSRLLSGNHELVMKLEKKLASLFGGESALLFNSGYVANTSLLATVTKKGDTIIYDSLIHASLHEGCRLSLANSWAFQHNNLQALEKKLQLAQGSKFVVIESVYSMDGDIAPLTEIVKLCQAYQAYLIVDEAHSTGIYGTAGSGLCCQLGIQKYIFARVYTFGKAIGVHGACVVGSQILIDYLINFAKGFIYTTSLPPHNLVSIETAFDFIAANPQLAQQLQANIACYDTNINTILSPLDNINIPDKRVKLNQIQAILSPIKFIKVSENEACRFAAQKFVDAGFEVRAILSPTVPKGEERIRICLHHYNTLMEIQNLLVHSYPYVSA